MGQRRVSLIHGVAPFPLAILLFCLPGPAAAQGTCWDARTGDHRPCGWNPSTTTQPDPEALRRQREAERKRQEEERKRKERLRMEAEAREAKNRLRRDEMNRALERAKSDAESLFKDGSASGGSTLELKTGSPTFGMQPNPGGRMQLKDASAVPLSGHATVDPSFFTRPRKSLRIRYVPNPVEAPKGTWLRYVKSDRAKLILDALEDGHGDLDRSIRYLNDQIAKHELNLHSAEALSYLEGLKVSYIAAGAQYRQRTKFGGPTTLDSEHLVGAIVDENKSHQWPGPKNPNPGAKPPNPEDWREKRTNKMLEALEASPGNLEKTYRDLNADRNPMAAGPAEHYLRGVFAYWDYLGTVRTR